MKPTDIFFKANPAASSVIVVGDRLFLSAYSEKAERQARLSGNKLKVVNRPKKAKAKDQDSSQNVKSNKDEK